MRAFVKIALIGCGRAGRIHARNFAGRVPGARLVAVADPVEDAARAVADEFGADSWYTDYREMLEDAAVDAVVVVTPTKYHREIVVAAAAAGKHVLCEKPMAMSADECRAMIDATDSAGVKLQIGFMRRFDEGFRAAKASIDAGVIGEVVLVKSLTHGPSTPQDWMYDIGASNGPLAEVSSHDIDTVRWFSGSEIVELHAIAGNYRCADARGRYPDFYDTVVVNARLANGKQAVIEGAVAVAYGYDARVEILGTRGTLFVGGVEENRVTAVTPAGGVQSAAVKSWRTLFTDAYEAEDVSFVQAIRSDTQPEVTGLDGLRAVEIVNAGNDSIRTGRPVTLGASVVR